MEYAFATVDFKKALSELETGALPSLDEWHKVCTFGDLLVQERVCEQKNTEGVMQSPIEDSSLCFFSRDMKYADADTVPALPSNEAECPQAVPTDAFEVTEEVVEVVQQVVEVEPTTPAVTDTAGDNTLAAFAPTITGSIAAIIAAFFLDII